jgi:hypothetical protein
MSALKNKLVGCHFWHQFILNEAGAIALRDGAHGQFLYVDEANNYVILVIIEGYLVTALHGSKKK